MLSAELQYHREALVERLQREIEEHADEQVAEFEAERPERFRILAQLGARVRAFQEVFARQSDYQLTSQRVHQLAISLLASDRLLDGSDPHENARESGAFTDHWRALQRVAARDPVVAAAVNAVPDVVAQRGVVSQRALQRRWRSVEAALRRAAFVPQNYAQSVPAQAVARLFAAVAVPQHELLAVDAAHSHAKEQGAAAAAALAAAPTAVVESKLEHVRSTDLDRINRAGYFVDNGELLPALRELDALSPEVAAFAASWAQLVRERVMVQQALSVVKSRATTLSLAFS